MTFSSLFSSKSTIFNTVSLLLLLLSLLLLATTTTMIQFVDAQTKPTCTTTEHVTAATMRKTEPGVLISVYGDWTNVPFVPGASTTKYLNGNMSSTEGQVEVAGAFLFNDTEPSKIAITFKSLPSYWLGAKNDTVNITLPAYFFHNHIPCDTFVFPIVPDAGKIDTTYVPSEVTEITINKQDVTFDIYIEFDRFITPDIWLVNPANFTVTAELPLGAGSNMIRVTVQKNQTYNPIVGQVDKLVIIFHKYMMLSKVAPIIGDGISQAEVAIPFKGVEPIPSVTYQSAAGALLSEDLWDGLGWVSLVLEGDTFVENNTLWTDTATQPTYEAAKPKSKYGFDYFFTNFGMRPSFNITPRVVNLTFPALVGFTIPSVVDQMRVIGLGAVTKEQRSIADVPVRVLRVKDESPIINYTGAPLAGAGVSEVEVRRQGFNISMTLKYNVWIDPPLKSQYSTMIRSNTLGTGTTLSFVETTAAVSNLTTLTVVIKPQTTYDIFADEIFNLTIWAIMTETRQLMVNNSKLFTIKQFTGSSICKINFPKFVKESDIRNVTGPTITFQVDIVFGEDKFCFTPLADKELRQSFQVATGAGNPEQMVTVDYMWNSSTNMSMSIRHDASFEITANVFLSMTLPPSIMCSMEICQADGSGTQNSAKLRLPIGATAGILVGSLPRVSEAFMRTSYLNAEIAFVGDAFVLASAGATTGRIPLTTTVSPIDSRGRGFVASFPAKVLEIDVDLSVNDTRGWLSLAPNASYDIVNEETITITVVSTKTASQLPPESRVIPLRVYPLLGILNVTYPAMTPPPPPAPPATTTAAPPPLNCSIVNSTTNETACVSAATSSTTVASTSTTTTAAATTTATTDVNATINTTSTTAAGPVLLPWVVNCTESEILNGSLIINMTLVNDRFDTAILPSTLRAQIEMITATQPSGIQANKAVAFADDAFWFDRNEFTMSVRLKPAPSYDITKPESFNLIFNGSVLVSRQNPMQFKVTFNVLPDPGILTMTGEAMLVSSFDIVNGFKSYSISLDGDKFVESPTFIQAELCVVTGGACEVTLDKTRRNITVTYDPTKDFFISRNQTYEIKLQPSYFDSNVLPIGFRNVTVFLSGGKLEWFMSLTYVSEEEVRSGKYTGLTAEKPIATASLSGDLFAALEQVRAAMATSVQCEYCLQTCSSGSARLPKDPYGFCSRAKNLFGSVFFKVRNERFIDVVLQPDDNFDVYASETVEFVIGGGATQSRLAPVVPGRKGSIVVYPTQGRFYISTSFNALGEQSISNAALASKVRLTVALYGERWLPNVTRVVELLVENMPSSRGTREINGWERYRTQILPPQTSGKTDATSRSLDLQFVAAPKYNVFSPEVITVKVPSGAVLSPFSPALGSVKSGFTIDSVAGFLLGSPSVVPDSIIQEKGFNITLQLRQAFWNQLPLLEFVNIDPQFSSNQVPKDNPQGFDVHRSELLSLMGPAGALPLNTSHVVFMIKKVPEYKLIFPEKITIDVPYTWVQGGELGKRLTPNSFSVTVMPEFPFVEAVVRSDIDLTLNESAHLLQIWTAAVAEKLAVLQPNIVILEVKKEWMVPESAPYYRIRFLVKNVPSEQELKGPYDNTATRRFVSMGRDLLEKSFNTSFAFYNATPPDIKKWNTLEGAAGALTVAEETGLALSYIGFFVLAIIVAFILIILFRRWTQGKDKNGLNWGESEGRVKADQEFHDSHELEEKNFDKAAELLFAGQREIVPYLADDEAASSARADAQRSAIAAKHGIHQDANAGIVHSGKAASSGYHLRTARPTSDGRDELAFFDLPDNLYSGQKTVQKRATDANVGMSLIDRMVTSGTDHSSRISKTGQQRLHAFDEPMSASATAAAASSARSREYVSPSEQKAKNPALFGSESRINDLLDKIAPAGGDQKTDYMTDLKGKLLDSSATPMQRDANANSSKMKLWNDEKAAEVMMPPHLVGKAQRFRPPAERR